MKPIDPTFLDSILARLPINGAISGIDYIPGYSEEAYESALFTLSAHGYVDLQLNGTGGIFMQGLTEQGIIFRSKGGFAEQIRIESQRNTDLELQRENWITTTATAKSAKTISIVSIVIAIIAVIVSVVVARLS